MLEIIVTTIGIATLLNIFLKSFKIDTIIGYIVTGTIIAYGFGLHHAAHSLQLKLFAEFGIVLLMFTIGLEFSITHLKRMKKEVFLYGGLQATISAFLIVFIALYGFNVPLETAFIIGTALALSSTTIVLKILNENGEINEKYGRYTLGILLFQDLAVIPILLMITLFSVQDIPVFTLFFETIIGALVLLFGLWLFGKYLLEPFLNHVSKINSHEIFIGSILLLVLGASYIAHFLGFSYSLGAFLAGMLIAETRYRYQVEADLVPFRDLLLGLFFVTVGMQIEFHVISNYIVEIILILVGLIVLKAAVIYLLLQFITLKSTALKSALSLFQLGEFGLVIFELASAKNLISTELTQVLIVVIILSMILTPFILRHISLIASYLLSDSYKKYSVLNPLETHLVDHVILIGYGRLGKSIAELLERNDLKYIVIEKDIKTVEKAQRCGKPVIFGNATQKKILKFLNIQGASSVVISIGNSKKLHLICESVKILTCEVKTVVKVNSFEEKQMLLDLGLSHIVVEMQETALGMFEELKKCEID